MKNKAIAVILVVLTLLPFTTGCQCKPPNSSFLAVSLVAQERDWWCWAACTEMISAFYKHKVNQCKSANYVHGTPPDCCTGCTGNCPCWGSGWGAYISDMKDNWTHWKFDYQYVASSVGWKELKLLIHCYKTPLYVVWRWSGGGGHVVTVYGYQETAKKKYVVYRDPWPPSCEKIKQKCKPKSDWYPGATKVRTYSAFVSSGGHSWSDTFHRFKYTGP